MDDLTKKDLEEALRAITSMAGRTEKAMGKFAQGTSHYTLQKNRLEALIIASSLISKELAESNAMGLYTQEDLEKALAPIASLISKSEKAQKKLAQGTWQHTMLSNNLKALYIASPLLTKALREINNNFHSKEGNMKEIQFSIVINAPKERVWATLWEDMTFRDWASIIDEGTYMKGIMKEGNEIQFLSDVNGYGVTSLIEKLDLNEFVLFRHSADTKESGQEEREKEWTGGAESYFLSEINGVTTLIVKTDVPQDLEEIFNIRLPRALGRIKTLAEKMKVLAVNTAVKNKNSDE